MLFRVVKVLEPAVLENLDGEGREIYTTGSERALTGINHNQRHGLPTLKSRHFHGNTNKKQLNLDSRGAAPILFFRISCDDLSQVYS